MLCCSNQSEASPDSVGKVVDPISWWCVCQRHAAILYILILIRVGIGKHKAYGEPLDSIVRTGWRDGGLEEPAPDIGRFAGLNEQGPLWTLFLQQQEMANSDSGWLSLHLGCFLLACLHLSLQSCFPSFINATVAEVLIFQFNLRSAAS